MITVRLFNDVTRRLYEAEIDAARIVTIELPLVRMYGEQGHEDCFKVTFYDGAYRYVAAADLPLVRQHAPVPGPE